MAEQFDVVVLGGGPGGYASALYGASAGLNIAIVEEARIGGTCLHRGCIPAKELLQTAEVLRTVRTAKEFGVDAGQPTVDLATSLARKQTVVDRLTKGLEGLLKGRKVTVYPGTGTVVDAAARLVRVSDGTEITATSLIIATGSAPRSIPGFDFDGERILSSDHVLTMDQVPGRVAIIGGGAIGCEFASYLADVGSEVTVLEALPSILPGVDKQVADVVARAFKKRRITVETGISVTGYDRGEALTLHAHRGDETGDLEVDAIVVSVGRRPRSENIGLEASGVTIDERGFIAVDDHMRTSVPGVYAVGDVVPTPALAHVGFAEAIVAIKTILGEPVVPIDYDRVPWGIYCHPEVSFTGLTEQAAIDRGYDVEVSAHRFMGNGRALIIGESDGMVKIVAERGTGVILGVHIAGPWATELIGEGYLAVNWEATAADLGALIHPHPTLGELFGESALALTGRSLHG
ncbi:MAG: dihydrolipoyl dehydrogenase [Acidimicrobiia bacterium]|nr:dihydrolipoyl dehydrogenase [Acidimicrobiia bacterium]